MYCKNCGRELKDGMRFCDRCGQSVRQSNNNERAAKRREIESLKEERLNRRKKLAEAEAEKAAKKKDRQNRRKSRKLNHKLIYGIGIFLIILVSAIVSYIVFSSESRNAAWKTQDESVELNKASATIQPAQGSQTPLPTMSALPTVAPEPENTDPVNDDGYRIFTISDKLTCPYPRDFSKRDTSGNVILNAMDTVGGATITITTENASDSKSAAELMKEYASSLGGKTEESLAGSGWYGLTVKKDGMLYHRKCIISDGKMIYYDFQYSDGSVSAEKYQNCINYMDNAFSG